MPPSEVGSPRTLTAFLILLGGQDSAASGERRASLGPNGPWSGAPRQVPPSWSVVCEPGTHDLADPLPAHAPALIGPKLRLPVEVIGAGDPGSRSWALAATAHAAAHGRFSHLALRRDSLKPVTQALIGLLEDARVETLAAVACPGLRRLWDPWHSATAAVGDGFTGLLLRLARALHDPSYDDGHPWVQKGVALARGDGPGLAGLGDGDEATLRRIASWLGHDICQLRKPFNDRTYVVGPSYRDDHRWMWQPTAREPEPVVIEDRPPPLPGELPAPPTPLDARQVHRYPEWDRLIHRLRPQWCTVQVRRLPLGEPARLDPLLLGRLRRRLHPAALGDRVLHRRQRDGVTLDLPAVVEQLAARRQGDGGDGRIYAQRRPHPGMASLVVLIDGSVSTCAAVSSTDQRPLGDLIASSGRSLAAAWRGPMAASIILAFRSRGRHQVEIDLLADAEDPISEQQIPAAGSTRLGTAVRHATALLRKRGGLGRLLVLTDGVPHDVDIHDPRYLIEDARHAVAEAGGAGIAVGCLVAGPPIADSLRRRALGHIFPRGGWTHLRGEGELPSALVRLQGRCGF